MKRIDRLVIGELIGPWVFGVAMFTVLIMAGSYLFKLSDYIVQGVPMWDVILLTALFTPGVLVKTFAMAMLLAGLLGFGRLSNDFEVTALKAAGASVFRMMVPVAAFALVIALVAFTVDETVVPYASKRSESLITEISKKLHPDQTQWVSQPVVQNGKVEAIVSAPDFDPVHGTLHDATVIVYDDKGRNAWYLQAHKLVFNPDQFTKGNGGWAIEGGATLLSADGQTYYSLDRAWPAQVPKPTFSIQDILASQLKDLDVLSMSEIAHQIQVQRKNPNASPGQIANLEYGYWNKIALPLAAFIYGLLGAPLGIRGGRASTAGGFALAVGIIFGYITLANLLNVYAMGGVIPAWVASFTPLVIGLIASGFIIWRRNI